MFSRKSKPKRKLRIERLEDRHLMAFNPFFVEVHADIHVDTSTGVFEQEQDKPATSFSIPELSSRPGAPATIFLDFDGHFQGEPVLDIWDIGGYGNVTTPAYDTGGDQSVVTYGEAEDMRYIWMIVAEDYAPFNINVTTIDPGSFSHTSKNLRIAIGGKDFRGGEDAGGVADFNAFTDEGAPNIVHVFPEAKSGGFRDYQDVAEAASHEAGHAFGLYHQSRMLNGKVQEYNSGDAFRAPIMGIVDGVQRGTWSNGPYVTYSQFQGFTIPTFHSQDDMAIIASSKNGFGYRSDDHGGGFSNAATLGLDSRPGLHGAGVIETTADLDMFRFDTGGGNVSVKLTIPEYFGQNVGNLEASLSLYNANGTLIATDADPGLLASLDANLAAGTYYVQVGSYGFYGDVGQYSLTVTEKVGARVVGAKYGTLKGGRATVLVTFNEPINPLTFTKTDVRLNSGAAGAGVLSIGAPTNGSRTFLVTIKPTGTKLPKVSIGPNINDLFGNSMDQNQNGIPGEAVDHYMANFLKGSSSTKSKKSLSNLPVSNDTPVLAPKSVDALFGRRR